MRLARQLPAVGTVLALSGFVMASSARAADTNDDELKEVIVTGHSLEVTTPLELSRYGNDVEFVSSAEVQKQGFVDVSQALEMLVPGAYVAPQAGAFSYINLSLQGSRTGDVLWTVDGVRINNRLYNGTSPADTLPASMIERIEVLKGGEGLLYGTQAVAGVINVVTKAFSDQPDGAISAGGDSRDGLHLNGYARGSLGGNHFVGWASKDKTDGYNLYDAYRPGATTRDRHYDVDSYGLKYGYDFTEALRLTLQGVHTDAALDYPTVSNTNVNDRNEEIWSGRLDYQPGKSVQLFVKSYYHDWHTWYFPVGERDERLFWGYKDFGFSAASQFDPGHGLQYNLGADYQNYRGRDEVLIIDGLTERAKAVYGQVRTTDDFSTSARFAAGLRYNKTGGSKATIWNTSGVYNFTDSLYAESSFGTAFQLPDAEELYAKDPDEDARGNANLKPEESFNVNVAIGGRLQAGERPLTWKVSGWKRRIKNLIDVDEDNPPAGYYGIYVNTDGKVKVSGTELLLRGSFTDALTFDASYMFSRERAPDTGEQLQDRPKNTAKIGLGFEPPGSSWGTDIAVKYMGTTHADLSAPFGRTSYGDAIITNLGAWWYVDGTPRHHRVGLRVENLFDKSYATRLRTANIDADDDESALFLYRYRGSPRTAFLNYTYNF
ncbi:MAG: TonB-dependent receptor [Pseudomonadota bacterium]